MSARTIGINSQVYVCNTARNLQSGDKTLESRIYDFLKEHKFLGDGVDLSVPEGIFIGGCLGGIAGGAGGFCVGGPPGAGIGLAIGIPVGMAIGGLVATSISSKIYYLPMYHEYVLTAEGKAFAENLKTMWKEEIEENHGNAHLFCTISMEPVVDAVYIEGSPNNIYERAYLEKSIEKYGMDPLNPAQKVTKAQIVSDPVKCYESAILQIKFLRSKRELIQDKLPQFIKGFDIFIEDLRTRLIEMKEEKRAILLNQLRTKQIDVNTYHQYLAALEKQYVVL